MNINIQTANNTFLRNLSAGGNSGLKSTRQKLERQQKRDDKIAFWENRKENLKDVKCDSLEEIGRKLEMFHSYEDEIAAAKTQYNNEQMFHILDEAKERAEKLAKKLEETRPKTPEERREDMAEKALETEDSDGVLSEVLEDITELTEDISQKAIEATLDAIEEYEDEKVTEPVPDEALREAGTVPERSADALERRQLENYVIKKKQMKDGFDVHI